MALLLALMTVLTFLQVVLRYGFGTGLVWSLEATTYSFAWLVIIGMSHGVRTRTHIAVSFVVTRMNPAARKAVGAFTLVLCMLYAGLLLYGSLVFVDRLYALGNYARDVPAPRWLLTGIMPLGVFLLGVRFGQLGWAMFTGRSPDLGFGGAPAGDAAERETR